MGNGWHSRSEGLHGRQGVGAARAELANGAGLQNEIWTQAVGASAAADSPSARMLLLPAINQMIDITTTRTIAAQALRGLVETMLKRRGKLADASAFGVSCNA